jgi:hypothetical protein
LEVQEVQEALVVPVVLADQVTDVESAMVRLVEQVVQGAQAGRAEQVPQGHPLPWNNKAREHPSPLQEL